MVISGNTSCTHNLLHFKSIASSGQCEYLVTHTNPKYRYVSILREQFSEIINCHCTHCWVSRAVTQKQSIVFWKIEGKNWLKQLCRRGGRVQGEGVGGHNPNICDSKGTQSPAVSSTVSHVTGHCRRNHFIEQNCQVKTTVKSKSSIANIQINPNSETRP